MALSTSQMGAMAHSYRPNKVDLLAVTVLIAYCLFLFRGVIFEGHLLFGSDFVGFYQGMKQFLYDEVHNHHSIPFWNLYVFSGMPFWAHLESTIFYPLDILFWFIPPERAFGYTMVMHMVLAGLFTYLLLRSFNTSPVGSFAGAVIFTCNGFIMATLYDGQMFRVQAYVWLPLVIYILNRALSPESSYINAVMAGLFWGFQILSGSPQDALYTMMAAIIFCTFVGFQKKPFLASLKRVLYVLTLFIAFGLGTSAIQTIPAIEFINLSVRSVFDTYELVTKGSYPPEGIITTIIPDFFGKYATGDFWVSGVPWSVPLYNLYVGILPLILLFFISFRNRRDKKLVYFAGFLAISAFFLALGDNTPLYKLLYLFPGFDRIRAPAKIIYLYVFAMSIVAAKGMDRVMALSGRPLIKRAAFVFPLVVSMLALDIIFHGNPSRILSMFSPFHLDEMIHGKAFQAATVIGREFHFITIMASVILLTILLAGKGILKWRTRSFVLCLLIIFDLTYMNWNAIRYGDEGYAWAKNTKQNLANRLGQDKSIFRVGSYPNSMGPNFEMYLGFQTVAGYNPLYLHRYYKYINAYNPILLDPGDVWFFYSPQGNQKLMDLLNVKYEISHTKNTYHRRTSYLPRLFFVPGHETLEHAEVLDALVSPNFDPRKEVLFEIEDTPDIIKNSQKPSHTTVQKPVTKIISHRPNEILASVETPEPGYLIFSEIYYPGWKAFVDERPAPVLRGNYLFRVVQVKKGTHSVRLYFEPVTITLGITCTITTLSILLLLVLVRYLRKKRD